MTKFPVFLLLQSIFAHDTIKEKLFYLLWEELMENVLRDKSL